MYRSKQIGDGAGKNVCSVGEVNCMSLAFLCCLGNGRNNILNLSEEEEGLVVDMGITW